MLLTFLCPIVFVGESIISIMILVRAFLKVNIASPPPQSS